MGGVCPNPDTKVHALLFDADSSTYRGALGSESTDDSGNLFCLGFPHRPAGRAWLPNGGSPGV